MVPRPVAQAWAMRFHTCADVIRPCFFVSCWYFLRDLTENIAWISAASSSRKSREIGDAYLPRLARGGGGWYSGYREYRYQYKLLRNTVALNSYLGLFVLCIWLCLLYIKSFTCSVISTRRATLCPKFWTQSVYLLESLNFVAPTKPNKHKTKSKDLCITWPNLFSNHILSRQSENFSVFCKVFFFFFSNSFSQHDRTVESVPVASCSARSGSPSSPTRASGHDKFLQTHPPVGCACSWTHGSRLRQRPEHHNKPRKMTAF